jgi:hypothetical protein
MEVGGQRHAPISSDRRRRPYTLLIGGWVDPQIVQTVASRYTGYSVLTHTVYDTDLCKISGYIHAEDAFLPFGISNDL